MNRTQKADWLFILSSTVVWLAGLAVIAKDFTEARKEGRRFGVLNLIGLLATIGGVALRRVSRWTLGNQFSYWLRTLDSQTLVKEGIYHSIRHPAYTGDLVFHLGLALLLFSPRGFALMLLLVPCFLFRIQLEERMLTEKFGQEYVDYMRASKRLVPLLY